MGSAGSKKSKAPSSSNIYTEKSTRTNATEPPRKSLIVLDSFIVLGKANLDTFEAAADYDTVHDVEAILTILNEDENPGLRLGGKHMFDHFSERPGTPEIEVEKCLMTAIDSRGTIKMDDGRDLVTVALNQVFTHDHGRLNVVVFDKLDQILPEKWTCTVSDSSTLA